MTANAVLSRFTVLALGLMSFPGCLVQVPTVENGADSAAPSGVPAPGSPQAAYLELTRKYGEALSAGDFAAAYALTSSHLQQRMTLEQFVADNRQEWSHRTEGAPPLRLRPETGSLSLSEIKDEMYAKASEVPLDVRRAWMEVEVALELDAEDDDEPTRCFHCFLLIVDDAGQNKVGKYEYQWCD